MKKLAREPAKGPPFRTVIAARHFVWSPPSRPSVPVVLEIGKPVCINDSEWGCPFRIRGLPKALGFAAHGIDAVQALELALVAAGSALSSAPEFRAGQIELFGEQVKGAADLFMPLPLSVLQLALNNMRVYLQRGPRKKSRDSLEGEFLRAMLSSMKAIELRLSTLAAYLPQTPAQIARRR